tara:strand:- start:189 stop:1238 length:1050 start_codon:yes stop_codon:yes gene_type:complete
MKKLLKIIGGAFTALCIWFTIGFFSVNADAQRRRVFRGMTGSMAKFVYIASIAQWTLEDEGASQSTTVTTLNCVGAGVACTASGADGTITITGDDAEPSIFVSQAVQAWEGNILDYLDMPYLGRSPPTTVCLSGRKGRLYAPLTDNITFESVPSYNYDSVAGPAGAPVGAYFAASYFSPGWGYFPEGLTFRAANDFKYSFWVWMRFQDDDFPPWSYLSTQGGTSGFYPLITSAGAIKLVAYSAVGTAQTLTHSVTAVNDTNYFIMGYIDSANDEYGLSVNGAAFETLDVTGNNQVWIEDRSYVSNIGSHNNSGVYTGTLFQLGWVDQYIWTDADATFLYNSGAGHKLRP